MNAKTDLKKIEKISKALGDPYRLKIMEQIKKEKCAMQCSCIVDAFKLSQSTVSHHLKQLIDADLIIAEKDGRHMNYRVNKDVFASYIKYLAHYES